MRIGEHVRRRAPLLAMWVVAVLMGCNAGHPPPELPGEVRIEPPFATLDLIGDTIRLGATVYYENGNVATEFEVVWSSDADSVAVVDSVTGLVRAVGPGTTRIVAEAWTAWSTAQVRVVAR